MATRKYSLVLFGSLGVAAIATVLVFQYINASTAKNRIGTLPVVVAAKDIPVGGEILEADVRVEQWPEPVVPENAFESPVRVSGRVAQVAIYAGEAIVPGRLAREGATPGLEAKISAGKRAMGVRINDVSGMYGMIQPNSRVDILLTLSDGNSGEQQSSRLFMEDMRVLAMGSEMKRGADGRVQPSSVAMIEVTPEEAELLGAAGAKGQLQLVLRGNADPASTGTRKPTQSAAAMAAALLRSATPASPPPARPTPPPPRRSPPVTAPTTAPVAAPTPPPVVPVPVTKAESLTVQVWRGAKRSDEKLKKDTIKPDTIRP